MKIEIETDGTASGTKIKFNGKYQTDLTEFQLSVRAGKNCKMQFNREDRDGNVIPGSFFGAGDFEKFDAPPNRNGQEKIGEQALKGERHGSTRSTV